MRRLRPRASRLLIALSLCLGAVTTLALRDHLAAVEARAAAPGPGHPVVVAVVDVERGAPIASGAVALRQLPQEYVPPGALGSVEEAVGRVVAADVLAGETLTVSRLAPPGGPLASLVPPGLRAVTVTVSAPARGIAAGDRVDLLATFAQGAPHTETIVREAEVLLPPEPVSGSGPGASAVVLLVTPETAERIAFARAFADLSVAIAPPLEVEA